MADIKISLKIEDVLETLEFIINADINLPNENMNTVKEKIEDFLIGELQDSEDVNAYELIIKINDKVDGMINSC